MTGLFPLLFALQSVAALPPPQVPPPAIADNSFLIEEAYNQEAGVVQHINVFQRGAGDGGWSYGFTQEWPLASQRQQLSYTLGALSTGGHSGFGDIALNWRYQVASTRRLAIAPRVSMSLPTGDSRRGQGAGGVGLQFNLPISVAASSDLILHSNVGTTIVPRARNAAGHVESTTTLWAGQSIIWPARQKFQWMLEALWTHDESFVLNPGVRWAHDFASGLQVVPGFSIPVTYAPDLDPEWGVLAYLSFEHPFGRRR